MSSGPTPAVSTRSNRSRTGRLLAAGLVTGIAVAGLAATTGESASAAAPLRAQAVGRFIDGTVGSKTLESLADVHDARATAPGSQSVQNPLDVTLLGQLNVPLTGVINLPTSPAVVAGAVNQVADAHLDGSSLGAAGAVSNQGGIEVGGANGSVPAVATIDLSAAALAKTPLSLPGAGDLSALGGITGSVGAVAAIATTKTGGAVSPAPKYNIAGLQLTLSSPALGSVLAQLGALLNPAGLPGLPAPISLPGATLPSECTFQAAALAPISFAGGGVTIDPTSGAVTLDLAKLLASAGANINALPANTDLVAWLVHYLTSPSGLAAGLQNVLTGIVQPGQNRLTACLTAIGKQDAAAQALLAPLVTLLDTGTADLTKGVATLSSELGAAAGGASPLAPLGTGLKSLIDIGVNVESGPGIQPTQSDPTFRFETKLAKTPNQATAVVPDQTLIRALEINVLPAAGGSGVATLALANAAVGPSTVAAPSSSGGLGVAGVSTQLPTGVPAGSARPTGTPVVPLALLGVGLLMAGAGAVAWKVRGRHV